jgi:fermentation-respiration switch protein FrsA (DUF1100 family)
MLRFLLSALLIYAVIVLLAWVFQARLLYLPGLPGREHVATPADIGLEYREIRLSAEDDVELDAWYIPSDPDRATLLFFHGNAGNISHRLESLRLFHRLGLSVLIIDYRGYGRSEGRPSEAGIRKDARAAWRWLTEAAAAEPGEIILFGRSLGAAVAAELAREVEPGAVLLESPFRSVPEMAQSAYPFLPGRWLARFEHATEDYVREINAPVLVIHSEDDEIIPFSHGQAVYEAARQPKALLRIRGGHNTGFLESRDIYLEGIDRFLREQAGL